MYSTLNGDCFELKVLTTLCMDIFEAKICDERLMNLFPEGLLAEYLGSKNGMEVRMDCVFCKCSVMFLVTKVRTKSFSDRF